MTSVERAAEIKPIVPGGAIVMEVEQEQPFPARIREGAERIDGFTIQFKGDSFWSVFHQCFYGRPDFPLPE